MQKIEGFLQTFIGLVLTAALAAGLALLFRAMRGGPAGQGYPPPEATWPPASLTPIGYPPPQATSPPVDLTQPAVPTPILIVPGQTVVIPTLTPWPTPTPQPTPTRRPGPTATGLPPPTIAPDASGAIWYATLSGQAGDFTVSTLMLPVNQQGQARGSAEPVPLPADIDLVPVQVSPSPDRRYLALLQLVEPLIQPYVFDQQTQQLKEVATVGQFFGWHPDSRQFLFLADGVALRLINAETLETTTLAVPPDIYLQGAAISPDGLTVAYIVDGYPEDHLWMVSSAGGDAQPVFSTGPQSILYPSAWSPDSTQLVYWGQCEDSGAAGTATLCLYNRATGERQALHMPAFAGGGTPWSPDGRYLAFTGVTETDSVCVSKAPATESERVHCQYAGRSVYLADTLSRDVRPLTAGIEPAWSPDGARLAFLSNRGGSPEVWTIQADGSALHQLTTDGQPKSQFIAWLAEASTRP